MATTTASTLRNRLLSRARFRHLHVFVKVAELQTVNRAAEAVGITQPSATQALADLEKLLECELFLRHSHGMALTPAGIALLQPARKALAMIDETATQAVALAHGSNSVVRVAAISAAMGSCLGEALPAFARDHPDVLVHLEESDSTRQAGLIADGDIDCAICRLPPVLPAGWTFTAEWPDRFAIVAGPSHPLANRQVVMDDLLGARWLVMATPIAARTEFDSLFASAPALPSTYNVVTASATMVWTLLTREPLLALIPVSVAQRLLEAKLLIEIDWSGHSPFAAIGLLLPAAERRSPALNRFVDSLRRSAALRNGRDDADAARDGA
jgi:DNA-binding transcriptional LysR family regulator